MNWLIQLQERNSLLFWFGLVCLAGGILAAILTTVSNTRVLGINAWIKPMKFFLSIWIFAWTMGWLLFELHRPLPVYHYSIMVIMVMSLELCIIVWQAAHGRMSHFNVSSPLNGALFSIMGIAIALLAGWTLIIGLKFFSLSASDLQAGYLWGIRLGIIFFVIFSFEGGLMASRLSHTVGAADGGPGLPILNWSKKHGDLRVSHFFGLHSLQLLPLLGFHITRNANEMIIAAAFYFIILLFLFIRAIKGYPFIKT